MTAVEIIDEIKHLPPGERDEVIRYIHALEEKTPWTAQRLTESATRLAAEDDSARARSLRNKIAAGFYGGDA
jgi:hypothetical protein